nr:hypothetical protein Iba_chr11bCG3410 [Ipomoea batatas]
MRPGRSEDFHLSSGARSKLSYNMLRLPSPTPKSTTEGKTTDLNFHFLHFLHTERNSEYQPNKSNKDEHSDFWWAKTIRCPENEGLNTGKYWNYRFSGDENKRAD